MDLVPKEYKQQKEETGKLAGSIKPLSAFQIRAAMKASSQKGTVVFLSVILVILVIGWGGMKIYGFSLSKQIAQAQTDRQKVFTDEDYKEAQKIVDLQNGAVLIQDILKNHIYTSDFFGKLSEVTLPEVQWETYSMDVKMNKITSQGKASSYSILAKQILALEEAGYSKISVSGVSLDKIGGVKFNIAFEFNSKIIQK